VNAERRSLENVAVPLSAVITAAGNTAAGGLTGGLTAHVRRTPQTVTRDEYFRA
jgi:hypothetical protein